MSLAGRFAAPSVREHQQGLRWKLEAQRGDLETAVTADTGWSGAVYDLQTDDSIGGTGNEQLDQGVALCIRDVLSLAEDSPLSPRSINMTVTLLAAILDGAVERELIARNPARGKARRVRERAPVRSYLESAAQIAALLNAAGELDREAHCASRHIKRRAMLAALIFAGLRIGELLALPLGLIDLAAEWLDIEESKTAAGVRKVKIRGALNDELAIIKDGAEPGQRLEFPTSTGRQMGADNFRNRVLAAAVKRANANLAAEGKPPLPARLTPHSLRRTFCSLLYALGEDPGTVMDEMGHTDPALALRVYRQSMRRGEDEKAQLRALIEGRELAGFGRRIGRRAAETVFEAPERKAA